MVSARPATRSDEKAAARGGVWRAIGPGVLFTGTAVGVSHLVQSTRAGADFGFQLLLVVLLANALKYPAFRFGPHYSAATGYSLLEGYRRQGRWALWMYAALTAGTMFTVLAAVSVVTAGLLKHLLKLETSPVALSALVIAVCAGILAFGRFRWLDRVNKAVVSVLALSTVLAAAIALPSIDWGAMRVIPDARALEPKSIVFIAALIGWMPSAIDVAVWQSLWTLARARDTGHRPTVRQSMVDFHAGYWGTAFLAVCFLVLGAGVMYGSSFELAGSAGGFAAQVIELYARTLGEWSRPVIALSALLTMFSTTLTVVDGFPRALANLFVRFRGPEERGELDAAEGSARKTYWIALAVLSAGAIVVLVLLFTDVRAALGLPDETFQLMIDLATTLSFLTAPILAWINHRVILSADVPDADRPKPWLVAFSWTGIVALGAFALYYLWLQFLA